MFKQVWDALIGLRPPRQAGLPPRARAGYCLAAPEAALARTRHQSSGDSTMVRGGGGGRARSGSPGSAGWGGVPGPVPAPVGGWGREAPLSRRAGALGRRPAGDRGVRRGPEPPLSAGNRGRGGGTAAAPLGERPGPPRGGGEKGGGRNGRLLCRALSPIRDLGPGAAPGPSRGAPPGASPGPGAWQCAEIRFTPLGLPPLCNRSLSPGFISLRGRSGEDSCRFPKVRPHRSDRREGSGGAGDSLGLSKLSQGGRETPRLP